MWGTGKVGIKCEGEFLGWVYVFVQFHWTIPPDLDVRVCTFWCRYFSALFFFHLERAGSDFTGSDTTGFPRPQLVGSVSGFHRVNSTFPDFSYVFSWMRSGQLMLGFTGSKLYWVSRLSLSAVCVSWFGGSQSAFRECVLLEGLFSPAHPAVPLEVSRDTFFYLRLFFPVFFLFFSTTTATAAVHFDHLTHFCPFFLFLVLIGLLWILWVTLGHCRSFWVILSHLGSFWLVLSSRLSFLGILSCFVKVGCLELFLVILGYFGSFEFIWVNYSHLASFWIVLSFPILKLVGFKAWIKSGGFHGLY